LPVGGTNDENNILGVHAIHLSQQLVQHSVSSTSSITNAASPLSSNGVMFSNQLVGPGRLGTDQAINRD